MERDFEDMDETLGFEDDNYPQVYTGKVIRVCHGWFFPDIEEWGGISDEPAWYLETVIDAEGKTQIILDTQGVWFDFETSLLDYIYPNLSSAHSLGELIHMGLVDAQAV